MHCKNAKINAKIEHYKNAKIEQYKNAKIKYVTNDTIDSKKHHLETKE